MSFEKLCDIHIEHRYYNAQNSERLQMQLIPSAESMDLIRKKRIVIKNRKNLFTLYGDVYTEGANDAEKKPKSEFKLSFALTVSDRYFLLASDLPLPVREDLSGKEIILGQGNPKTAYYFHNNRENVIDSTAFLSNAQEANGTDLVSLYPLTFVKDGLKALYNLSLMQNIAYDEDDRTGDAYRFYTIVDPADAAKKRGIFEADFTPFGSGIYTFQYSHELDNTLKEETTNFYLNNQFYALRPFAVIDLFFYNDIHDNFKALNKNYYISIPARRSYWRYNIISKYNRYEDLKIISDPGNLFPDTGIQKSMKNGESAIVFESLSKLEFRQVMDNACELMGTHIETLGMTPPDEDDEDDGEKEKDKEKGGSPLSDKPFRQLPNPRVENLVLEKLNAGTEDEEIKFYSDLFIYI